MAINKVVYGDQTLVDLTSDTATAEDVAQGKTFHDASGQLRTGSNTGSGGHIIQDASGTDLAQEAKLQFGGMLKTTDDSENGVTKVSDLAEEIDWSVWNAMTEAERTAYSEGKKLDIINVPSVSGSIPVELIKTLWTNPNPSEAFAAQTITLNSDDYDFLLVETKYAYNSSYRVGTLILTKGSSGLIGFGDVFGGISKNVYRTLTRSSNTSYSFTDAHVESTVNNNYLIPLAIYGIKSSVNVDMSALVANVSTDARKCMLSDGETSVEDALDVTIGSATVPTGMFSSVAYNKIVKKGNLVFVQFGGVLASGVTGRDTVVLNIPSAFRASQSERLFSSLTYNDSLLVAYLCGTDSSGDVVLSVGSGQVTGLISIHGVYVI